MKHKLSLLGVLLFTAYLSSAFTVKNIDQVAVTKEASIHLQMGGNWNIGYYFDGKTDQTESFSAYTFDFNGDGSISIFHGGTVGYPGQYETSGSTMNLMFNQEELSPLNGSWDIIVYNDSQLKLQRGESQLVFAKNGNSGFPPNFQ